MSDPKVRRPSITIDATEPPSRRDEVRERLKHELADLHDHAAFDTITPAHEIGSSALDPELGHVNARRVAKARRAMRSTGSQFILGLIAAVTGLGLAVYAAAEQSLPMLIAAGLIAPPCAWYGHKKYRLWLQNKRYLYRLLEALGEDVSNLAPARR